MNLATGGLVRAGVCFDSRAFSMGHIGGRVLECVTKHIVLLGVA